MHELEKTDEKLKEISAKIIMNMCFFIAYILFFLQTCLVAINKTFIEYGNSPSDYDNYLNSLQNPVNNFINNFINDKNRSNSEDLILKDLDNCRRHVEADFAQVIGPEKLENLKDILYIMVSHFENQPIMDLMNESIAKTKI